MSMIDDNFSGSSKEPNQRKYSFGENDCFVGIEKPFSASSFFWAEQKGKWVGMSADVVDRRIGHGKSIPVIGSGVGNMTAYLAMKAKEGAVVGDAMKVGEGMGKAGKNDDVFERCYGSGSGFVDDDDDLPRRPSSPLVGGMGVDSLSLERISNNTSTTDAPLDTRLSSETITASAASTTTSGPIIACSSSSVSTALEKYGLPPWLGPDSSKQLTRSLQTGEVACDCDTANDFSHAHSSDRFWLMRSGFLNRPRIPIPPKYAKLIKWGIRGLGVFAVLTSVGTVIFGPPDERIGRTIREFGGWGGAFGGLAIGTKIRPGVGSMVGAVAGGFIGNVGGECIGRYFSPKKHLGLDDPNGFGKGMKDGTAVLKAS